MNEHLRETSEAAKDQGFIDTLSLSLILAAHPYPFKHVLKLWKRSNLDLRGKPLHDPGSSLISNHLKFKISEDLNLGERSRVAIWDKLLSRWTTGRIAGVVAPRPLKITLNIYRQLDDNNFEQSDSNAEGAYFVKLQGFKGLLERFKVPLPEMLYASEPPVGEAGTNNSDELILQYGFSAERLYDCIEAQLKAGSKTFTSATTEDRQSAAINAFDADPDTFSPLSSGQVAAPGPYDANSKYRRKIVGMLIMSANIPGAGPDYQALYSRFLELKSSK